MYGGKDLSRRWLAPAIALLLGSCALAGRADPFSEAQAGPQKITIHVRNLNFSDATLWAASSARRQRLGTIGGKQDAVYVITWEISEPMRIEIDLLAGPRCWTEDLWVDPGDILELQIEGDYREMRNCRPRAGR